ncbi:hypothetical protein TRICI_006528 [Trichomonascus ciferrii]|uniref:Uncharacterized protein n=1 Tax=Trichomonascus ciferrii TaxID=44093 RepID=A0A6A1LJR0_9ASCO|nr:hypothetical protein TRICI_006528 [Trichomonascus ciferrii]
MAIEVVEPHAHCFEHIRGRCYKLNEEPEKPGKKIPIERLPNFSGRGEDLYNWGSMVNGFIASYKAYVGRNMFRDMVISKIPLQFRMGLSTALTDYYEVFMFLDQFLDPPEPVEEIKYELDTMPINLLNKLSIQDYMKKHVLLCKSLAWDEERSREDLLARVFDPISVTAAGVYRADLPYDETAACIVVLMKVFAENAAKRLKNDKSVDLTKVTKSSANTIFGKLCDCWAEECGGDYKKMMFETNSTVFSDKVLYEMMLKCGSFKAHQATKKLIVRAITEESGKDKLYDELNAALVDEHHRYNI